MPRRYALLAALLSALSLDCATNPVDCDGNDPGSCERTSRTLVCGSNTLCEQKTAGGTERIEQNLLDRDVPLHATVTLPANTDTLEVGTRDELGNPVDVGVDVAIDGIALEQLPAAADAGRPQRFRIRPARTGSTTFVFSRPGDSASKTVKLSAFVVASTTPCRRCGPAP